MACELLSRMPTREYLQKVTRESRVALRQTFFDGICEEAKMGVMQAAIKGGYAFSISIPDLMEEMCTYEEITNELKLLFPDCDVVANGNMKRICIAWN
jgi:hypothetical protein